MAQGLQGLVLPLLFVALQYVGINKPQITSHTEKCKKFPMGA